jgi:hypothetical protein
MKTEPHTLTRREALLGALQGTVVAALAVPLSTTAAEPSARTEPEFVPENDYPWFGWEPEPLA